jgi:hypothetical protein
VVFYGVCFLVDLFWYVGRQDMNSVLNKVAEEKFMGVMSGDVGEGCPYHSQ